MEERHLILGERHRILGERHLILGERHLILGLEPRRSTQQHRVELAAPSVLLNSLADGWQC